MIEPGLDLVGEGIAVALLGALEGEVPQVAGGPFLVGVARVVVGDREAGQARASEVDLDVGPLGDEQGVVAGLGELGEEMAHLGGRLEVVLVAFELEPLGIVDEGAGLHAQQGVVGHVVLAVGVVAVVGGEQRRPDPPGDVDQRRVGLVLRGQAVVLELDEEVVPPEDVLQPAGQGLRLHPVVGQQGLEDDAAQAAGGGDEAVGVAGQQLPVDPWLVVVALEVGGRGELEQVAVALVVLGQEGQVVVELLTALDVAAGVVHSPAATGRSWRDSAAM